VREGKILKIKIEAGTEERKELGLWINYFFFECIYCMISVR